MKLLRVINKMTAQKKQIKQITKASDLEGINPKEEVEITYYNKFPYSGGPYITNGLVTGIFEKRGKTHLMISKIEIPVYMPEFVFLISREYFPEEDKIMSDSFRLGAHCNSSDYLPNEEPEKRIVPGSKLEEHLNHHLKIMSGY
jgi:hypothetical protein